MADATRSPAWHGHQLRPLPPGESWLSGGARPVRPVPPVEYDDTWLFDAAEAPRAAASTAVQAPPASRRTAVFLVVVSLAAIITIIAARRTGAPAEPAPLPAPPSHAITAVSRAHPTTASIRVGEYLEFRLPAGRTYSTVLEQPSGQIPVVEALTLPGQQPQLRADSAGHAVIEVMSSPVCNNLDGCPDQRTLLGTVQLTVVP
ncbi:MAG TPA: hypothetical protein VHX15_13125 [Frankiaceae bacterium]|jgi:hypothetical protein|nr:hypothetical protein [Frankiaceae bacterium]